MPLLAVSEQLRRRWNSGGVVICGRREAEIEAASLFRTRTLALGTAGRTRIQRLLQMVTPLLAPEMLRAVSSSDAVLTTGSYAAVAPALAALMLRRPLFLIEPNALPGRFSRLFAGLSRIVFRGWRTGHRLAPHELVTGVPLRSELRPATKQECRRRLGIPQKARVLLVLGGSQGSRAINGFLIWVAPMLKRFFPNLWILHACARRSGGLQAARHKGGCGRFLPRYLVVVWLCGWCDMPCGCLHMCGGGDIRSVGAFCAASRCGGAPARQRPGRTTRNPRTDCPPACPTRGRPGRPDRGAPQQEQKPMQTPP